MSDDLLRTLAGKSGIELSWRDQSGASRDVGVDTLRALLKAIGLPAENEDDLRNSLSVAEIGAAGTGGGSFLTARVDQNVVLPIRHDGKSPVEIELETGGVRSITPLSDADSFLVLPPFEEPGYHKARCGDQTFTIATAPRRAVTISDLSQGQPVWGLAAQIYSLRRNGDLGIGDFGAAAALGRSAAQHGADMLMLSPAHALFSAQPGHFSPYSPSSRLFYNPLHADPRSAMPDALVMQALAESEGTGGSNAPGQDQQIDWPVAAARRQKQYRVLFDLLNDPARMGEAFRSDFTRFREQASPMLLAHATFEALSAWTGLAEHDSALSWPEEYRDPAGAAVKSFVAEHGREVDFHLFQQWLASRSIAECQRICRDAGMRIGIVSDLAIGMEARGSHAWSRRKDILETAKVGAPPDYYNTEGQNWGLSTFSPRGLIATSFDPFIETLRASMRYAGGLRMDHVMGLSRLWLVPDGASATEGAYLNYPSESMFRLTALESWRHKAIVIGEDLGTLPDGFQDYLREQGIAGLRVLRFERDGDRYRQPGQYDSTAVALTTTHDLVPTAGWWRGHDIQSAQDEEPSDHSPAAVRAWDRGLLWSALAEAGLVEGERPADDNADPVVDAVIGFVARTPCAAKLVALEDLLGIVEQPNVPGTVHEHPNWQYRFQESAETILDQENAKRRMALLGGRLAPNG